MRLIAGTALVIVALTVHAASLLAHASRDGMTTGTVDQSGDVPPLNPGAAAQPNGSRPELARLIAAPCQPIQPFKAGAAGPYAVDDRSDEAANFNETLRECLGREEDWKDVSLVLLLGHADRRTLRSAAQVQFGSNVTLAFQRALWVQRQLLRRLPGAATFAELSS